jgi:hypothetical protein
VRHLAWLLLLANLGMLAWVLTQPQPQVLRYRPVPVPPGIEPLVLLSERNVRPGIPQELLSQEPATGAVPSGAPPVAVAGTQEPPVAASVAASEAAAADTTAPATVAAKSEQESFCQTVGPLQAEADASMISAQLTAQGFPSHLRTEEIRQPAGYWVFMPAMPAADARRIVAELDAHGLTDHYVGNHNYISLGIFSRKEKAQQHLDHIKALGFDAILDARYRTGKAYWLDVAAGETSLLRSQAWAKIQEQHPDIRAQRVACE